MRGEPRLRNGIFIGINHNFITGVNYTSTAPKSSISARREAPLIKNIVEGRAPADLECGEWSSVRERIPTSSATFLPSSGLKQSTLIVILGWRSSNGECTQRLEIVSRNRAKMVSLMMCIGQDVGQLQVVP